MSEQRPVLLGSTRSTKVIQYRESSHYFCRLCQKSLTGEQWVLSKARHRNVSSSSNAVHYHIECAIKAGFDIVE